MGHRQLAALVLKRVVKERWDRDSKHFKPPELGGDEKAAIKRDIVPGLADPHTKVRVAIGMVIAGKAASYRSLSAVTIYMLCVETVTAPMLQPVITVPSRLTIMQQQDMLSYSATLLEASIVSRSTFLQIIRELRCLFVPRMLRPQ